MKIEKNITDESVICSAPCDEDLSLDFISGLIVGEGCFTWVKQNGTRIPAFQLAMHWRDTKLIEKVRDTLGLSETVYRYIQADGRKKALLLVRRRESLENIIIPIFSNRLTGYKKVQFIKWQQEFLSSKEGWKSKIIHIKDALKNMGIPFYTE